MTTIVVIACYMGLLVAMGVVNKFYFRGTSADYFVASRSIGPFMLLMSIFGTTMTGFALVGSTGKAYDAGIGVYGLMASWSGLIHSLLFFVIGIKLWAYGKRYGYMTQIQFFRDRFESNGLGWLLFPILVGLVIPYLLVGVIGAGLTVRGATAGAFPELFPMTLTLPNGVVKTHPLTGAIPLWLTGLVVCSVVLFYVFIGGVRSAAWANTFQTILFMIMGVFAFWLISSRLGGPVAATQRVLEVSPKHLAREGMFEKLHFFSYFLVPFSVGMFPHLFQHWLTAKSAKSFRLTVVAHPIFIMIVWLPCIMMGIWAVGQGIKAPSSNAILGKMVGDLIHSEFLSGMLVAGVLAAIMSSLDSQFVCIGTMFTNDVVLHHYGKDRFTDAQKLWIGRGFVVVIVAATYAISLFDQPHVFDLGVWCFSGFASLTPLVFAALYWKRATKAGAIASVLVMAAVWGVLFYQDMTGKGAAGGEDEKLIYGMMPVVFIFAASAATLVAVSLFTKPPSPATIEKFFPAGRTVGAADAVPVPQPSPAGAK